MEENESGMITEDSIHLVEESGDVDGQTASPFGVSGEVIFTNELGVFVEGRFSRVLELLVEWLGEEIPLEMVLVGDSLPLNTDARFLLDASTSPRRDS